MKKHQIIATAITALLAAGGTVLAGEGVLIQQNDPYASGNWQAQATEPLDGVVLDQRAGDWSNFSAQPTAALRGQSLQIRVVRYREASVGFREAGRVARYRESAGPGRTAPLCDSRLLRLYFDIRDIELNCP